MSRSSWKGIVELKENLIDLGVVLPRSYQVMPTDIGRKVLVSNGKVFYELTLSKYMVYKKLGTLAFTKKICVFRSKKGKKKKK